MDLATVAAAARRWNVVVVRPSTLGPGAPRAGRPALVFTGDDRGLADRTVQALRDRAIEVVLVEGDEDSLCHVHPTQLLVEECGRCRRRICAACHAAAGAALCPTCDAEVRRRARTTRVRQLFALFVFAVFLTRAWTWQRSEAAQVDATGLVRVMFVQLVRPEAQGNRLVSGMTNGGLHALAPWFQAERARYGAPDSPVLDLHVLGPWVSPVAPPALSPRAPSLLDQLRVGLELPGYFHQLAREHGVNPADYGARMYIVYGNEDDDLAGDSRGSRQGRLGIVFLPIQDTTLAYAQVTVAHELAHILGARDLYDEDTFLARFPEGYVQPWADPAYPQKYAELMAVDRPISPSDEREITSLDEVRVGYRTAADIGWIPEEQADRYFDRPLTDPDAGLSVTHTEGERPSRD